MGNGRGYEHSHPWIGFTVDLRPAAVRVWSLLGQAVAGCRQIADAALPPLDGAEMYRLYLSRGARASTAIEGNTLSEAQVRARLDGQLELPPSQEYLGREVDTSWTPANVSGRRSAAGTCRGCNRICSPTTTVGFSPGWKNTLTKA